MIILFEENEVTFNSIGLGILKDAKSCTVKETLNDTYELELEYPILGQHYSKLKINRIISAPPDPYSENQPFRIYHISKPINGIVTISAFHISYDMNGLIVGPINAVSLKNAIDEIQNGCITNHNFKLYTDKTDVKAFKTSNYYNMRALVLGSDGSLLEKFGGDLYFNKFNVYLLKQRGSDKGAQVRYAKNLKDITHEISYDKLYNGVYPFYHQETTTTSTNTTSDGFKQVYIVGSKPYQDGWLSYTDNGEPYHPIDESPVQIATEGAYFQKVYTWNSITQRYVERIYNEMVTLIDSLGGLLQANDTPSWIYIDWTGIPRLVVKANADGYFKPVTESDWKYYKKGEVVLDDSIKNIATNLIIYYAEVIPTSSSSETEETTSVTHVELDDKILWLETDAAKEMKFNRILSLDLTSEFEETPDKDALETKAKEYIEKNKIGQYKYNTTVSFVDLSATTEGIEYKNIEKIQLGDIVRVVYDDLGVDIQLRVITTKFDALLGRYSNVELGEKSDKISAESIQNGDGVSSLVNDVGYTDVTTVNKLIAKMITADYIKAKNAELSKAQIEQLTTARLNVTGMIEASQFEIDKLVAKLLIADNAEIKETLEAGTIKVNGDITVSKGEINIVSTSEDGTSTVFRVDRDGNLTANSVNITGGELNINDQFTVTPEGILSAQGADISGTIRVTAGSIIIGDNFEVTEEGILFAQGATINGIINANSGRIGSNDSPFIIGSNLSAAYIYNNMTSLSDTNNNGIYLGTDGIALGKGAFKVTNTGALTATSATITGIINANSGRIGNENYHFNIDVDPNNIARIYSIRSSLDGYSEHGGIYLGTDGISLGEGTLLSFKGFKVTSAGALTATNATITGNITVTSGSIEIKDGNTVNFQVTNTGVLTARSGYIGNGSNGFTISDSAIYNGVTSFSDTSHNGVYIGTDGIRLGPNFSVDASGNVTATSFRYIVSTTIKYVEDSQGTTPPGSSANWSTTIPSVSQGNFLWTRTDILYSDNSHSYSYSVSYQSEDGAPGSDATVTWDNMVAQFPTSSSTTKGIYYGTDHNGNLALLINATAGQIGGWEIYSGYLSYGILGSPNSCMISTSGLTGTVAGHTVSSSEQDASKKWGLTLGSNFGVTLGGSIYSDKGYIGGFEINTNKIGVLAQGTDPLDPTNKPYGIDTSGIIYGNELIMIKGVSQNPFIKLTGDTVFLPGQSGNTGYMTATTFFHRDHLNCFIRNYEGDAWVSHYDKKTYATLAEFGPSVFGNSGNYQVKIGIVEITDGQKDTSIVINEADYIISAMACFKTHYSNEALSVYWNNPSSGHPTIYIHSNGEQDKIIWYIYKNYSS